MTIISKAKVRAAVERALDLDHHGSLENAIAATAQALCITVETVMSALQPEGHCCETGQNLGVIVCDECEAMEEALA